MNVNGRITEPVPVNEQNVTTGTGGLLPPTLMLAAPAPTPAQFNCTCAMTSVSCVSEGRRVVSMATLGHEYALAPGAWSASSFALSPAAHNAASLAVKAGSVSVCNAASSF